MDDDQIMQILRHTLPAPAAGSAPEDPPARAVEAALAAGTWTVPDAEIATLVADSADDTTPPGVRGADAELRQLTYLLDDLTIECELAPDLLLGQAVPAAGLGVELVSPDGTTTPVRLREDGSFLVTPVPTGPIGIRCTRAGRPRAMTPWLLP